MTWQVAPFDQLAELERVIPEDDSDVPAASPSSAVTSPSAGGESSAAADILRKARALKEKSQSSA